MNVKEFGYIFEGEYVVELRCSQGNAQLIMKGLQLSNTEETFKHVRPAITRLVTKTIMNCSITKIYQLESGGRPRVTIEV